MYPVGEFGGLVLPLEQRRAEVHVEDLHAAVRNFDLDALRIARLATLPRQIVLRVVANRMPG